MKKEIVIEDEVKKLSTAGATCEQITKDLVKQTGIDERDVLAIYKSVEELWRRRGVIDKDLERGKAIAQLDMLFLAAVRIQDFKTALTVRKELNDLLNLKKAPRLSESPLLKSAKLERLENG